MANDDQRSSWWRIGATRVLSDLMMAEDAKALKDFAARRFDQEFLSLEDLVRAQHLLELVYDVVCSPGHQNANDLRSAWAASCADRRDELPPTEGGDVAPPAPDPAPEPEARPHLPAMPIPVPITAGAPRLSSNADSASPWVRRPPDAGPDTPSSASAAEVDPEASLDETSTLTAEVLAEAMRGLDDGLPFSGEAEGPPSPAGPAETTPHVARGATAAIRLEDLPPSPPPSGGAAKLLTPDGYAGLVARTAGKGDAERAAIHAELGVRDEAERSAIDSEMSKRLTSDVEAREAFGRRLVEWRRWLSQGGSR